MTSLFINSVEQNLISPASTLETLRIWSKPDPSVLHIQGKNTDKAR